MIHINIAYYEKKNWNRLLASIDDRESMHEEWNDWHKEFLRAKEDLIFNGFIVNPIIVDIDKLVKYCKIRGIKNDGSARSMFVQKG